MSNAAKTTEINYLQNSIDTYIGAEHAAKAKQIYASMLTEWGTPYFMRDTAKLAIVCKPNGYYFNGEKLHGNVMEFLRLPYCPYPISLHSEGVRKANKHYVIPADVETCAFKNKEREKRDIKYYDKKYKQSLRVWRDNKAATF